MDHAEAAAKVIDELCEMGYMPRVLAGNAGILAIVKRHMMWHVDAAVAEAKAELNLELMRGTEAMQKAIAVSEQSIAAIDTLRAENEQLKARVAELGKEAEVRCVCGDHWDYIWTENGHPDHEGCPFCLIEEQANRIGDLED